MTATEAERAVRDEIARQRRERVAQVRLYPLELCARHARRDAVGRQSVRDCEAIYAALEKLCRPRGPQDLFYEPAGA